MTRRPERGTAILITLIVIVALLGGGAVLVGMQMSSTRSTEVARSNMTSLYCAEAGLNAARRIVANNYPLWNAALALTETNGVGNPLSQPTWLDAAAIDHDLENDGGDDFVISLKDNDDELPPLAADLTLDNDLQIYIVSTCTKFPENKKQVSELIRFSIGGKCYDKQLGGCGGNNNQN